MDPDSQWSTGEPLVCQACAARLMAAEKWSKTRANVLPATFWPVHRRDDG